MPLASDFSGLVWLIFAYPLLLILTLISFFPAARGHIAAPILATPTFLFGLLLAIPIFLQQPDLSPVNWLLIFTPLTLSSASLLLWFFQRRARRKPTPPPRGFDPRR